MYFEDLFVLTFFHVELHKTVIITNTIQTNPSLHKTLCARDRDCCVPNFNSDFHTVLYPPAGDVLWWHTAAWPTGPATSSSTGRRRCGRPSSARWTPRLTATGAAPMATSLWSPAPPHRRTHMSCWPPPRHLRKTRSQTLDAVTEETETHKGHKGRGG